MENVGNFGTHQLETDYISYRYGEKKRTWRTRKTVLAFLISRTTLTISGVIIFPMLISVLDGSLGCFEPASLNTVHSKKSLRYFLFLLEFDC